MKTFDQYLDEGKLELVATLLEEQNFPLVELAEWYSTEGHCLTEQQLERVMEGFWAEAENTFWGDTWRSAAKGAGIGAGAGAAGGGMFGGLPGAGIGAGVGGLIGGAAGGLYGAGRNLFKQWHKPKEEPKPDESKPIETTPDYVSLFKKLAQERPELIPHLDDLLAKMNKAQQKQEAPPEEPHQQSQPLGRNPYDYDNLHPSYKRPGVNPIGDHTIR